jgi:hypothetical protein
MRLIISDHAESGVRCASGLWPLLVDALHDELGLLDRPIDEVGLGQIGLARLDGFDEATRGLLA